MAGSNTGGVPRAAVGGVPKAAVGGGAGGAGNAVLQGEVNALEGQLQELKLQNDTLEKERMFYFDKLREIEYLLQTRGEEGKAQLG